jgi:hypothetical protein
MALCGLALGRKNIRVMKAKALDRRLIDFLFNRKEHKEWREVRKE